MRPDANLPILLLLVSTPAQACGPYFDNTQLSWRGQAMLQAPTTDFKLEVQRLAAETEAPPLAAPKWVRTAQADRADLEALKLPEPLIAETLQARAQGRPLPVGTPEELQRYQLGAIALAAEDEAGAQQAFRAVLALPESERPLRGSWAAYMLGNMSESPDEAAAWYQRTRAEIAASGQDSLGLYVASLRQEAAAQDRAGAPVQALSLCLQYRSAGATHACSDLRPQAQAVLELEDLGPAVADPLVSSAIAALLSNPGSSVWWTLDVEEQTARWLQAAESQPEAVADADRLAWAAYRSGDMDSAARWLTRSPPTAVSAWIDGKLALQAGDLAAAEAALTQSLERLPAPVETGRPLFSTHCEHHPQDPARAVAVELGVLRVRLGDFTGALHAFVAAGDWMDAAWVAERLLTTDQLRAQVDLHWPEQPEGGEPPLESLLYGDEIPARSFNPSMRHLLARRLAREGDWESAVVYFPHSLKRSAQEIAEHLDKGQDAWRRDDVRGGHLWQAAYEMKQQGWALMATEMEPDFRVLEGHYYGADTSALRLDAPAPAPLFATQPAELALLAQTAPPNSHRYHFVWTAAELAETATGLMADDNPDLPQALCTSGLWQRHRDPAYRERAFRALAARVPDSELNLPGVYLEEPSMGLCQPEAPAVPRGCQSGPGRAGWFLAGLALLLLRYKEISVRKKAAVSPPRAELHRPGKPGRP